MESTQVCHSCGVPLGREGVTRCPSCESALPAATPSPTGDLTMTSSPKESPSGVSRFGDYELQGEIARGGMGIVYRAVR